MWLLPLVVLWTLSAQADAAVTGYNCTRSGSECGVSGTCNAAAGTCTCIQGSGGHDCKLGMDTVGGAACLANSRCVNGGTCYTTTVGPVCYCPFGFYGDICQFHTVYQECFGDRMIININPGRSFTGVVGLQGATGFCDIPPVTQLQTSGAAFIAEPSRSQWEGYAADLSFSMDPCGGAPSVNRTADNTQYTYQVLVQYDQFHVSPVDEVVTFSCTVQNVDPATAGRTAVLFSVTDAFGQPVTSPKLGSVIRVTFSVDPNSIFSHLLVKSCTMYDSTRTQSHKLVANSCAVPPVGVSLEEMVGGGNTLTLLVHRFGHDPQLNFECSVKVCTPVDLTCVVPIFCDNPTAAHGGLGNIFDPHMMAVGRRRRDAAGSDNAEQLIRVRRLVRTTTDPMPINLPGTGDRARLQVIDLTK